LTCQRAGKKTALVDLSVFGQAELVDYPTFLMAIISELLDKLGLDLIPHPEVRTQPGITRFMQRAVLQAVTDPLVLAFDEVDRVLGQPYQTDFFSMLRHWHERRTDIPVTAWARTELALVISTETYFSRFAQIWRYIPDCAKLWACMKYPT